MVTAVILGLLLAAPGAVQAQAKRGAPPRPPKPVPPRVEPAKVTCPESLGAGVRTGNQYCFVIAGRDPAQGVLIAIPPHTGEAILRFNLHNRHTYSEEEVRLKTAFASYIAGIGVLTLDNTLLTRAAVATEFRRPEDLLERITGGAGPGGVKAVAPVGTEPITLQLPAELAEVTILGEKLTVLRADGQSANYSASGRPIAIISDVVVEYIPAPAPAPARKR